ncbi:MAG: hypothetical protein H0V44_02860 [Planctomycetes bacterium]|nr:hypothetical protein [Planctomycetota bacterium]
MIPTAVVSIPRLLMVAALVLPAVWIHAEDGRDRITFNSSVSPRVDAFVVSEGSEEVTWKVAATSGLQKKKTKEVKRILYAGMIADGVWKKAVDAKQRGRYEEAAELFGQLADSGSKEWEKIYGAYQEGECWELAKKYDDAAKAFTKIVKAGDFTKDDREAPRHRLWIEGVYRLGVALAEAKKTEEANKVVESLTGYSKLKNANSGADARANGVRAAIAASAADAGKLREYEQKVILNPVSDSDTWFHFYLFVADTYRQLGKQKEALKIVERMIDEPSLATDPSRKAQAEVIRGLCLMESDPQGAIVELLKIDLLPYGSEDQKCEARFHAARLMLAEADKLKARPETASDERRSTFVTEMQRTARVLLSAASSASSNVQAKTDAKALLDKLGPDPAAAPAPGAAPAGDAGAPAPGAAKAPAPGAAKAPAEKTVNPGAP